MAQGKTNAVRLLDKAGVPYELHEYHVDMESAPRGGLGLEVARKAGIPPEAVFKTLVARGAGGHYVFVVPVAAQLDMKKAAAAVGEKRVELLPVAGIQKATGYIRGGCSPLGMKKASPRCSTPRRRRWALSASARGGPACRCRRRPRRWQGCAGRRSRPSPRARPPGTPYKNTEKASGRGRFLVPFPENEA